MKLKPKLHSGVFVADGAKIYGDVEIGEGSSVWFNAVIRGDEGKVKIGKYVNVQDNCVIHSDAGVETEIGDYVTVGHGAIIRGCRIWNDVWIGMNATIFTNSEIGECSIVGASALVLENEKFPPRSLILGVPAKVTRELDENEIRLLRKPTEIYGELVKKYSEGIIVGA